MAQSALSLMLLLSLAVVPEALRKRRGADTSDKSSGYVHSLYTWGAPAVHEYAELRDPRTNGCWRGLRIVNINTPGFGFWDSDVVSGVANTVGYEHHKMPTARLTNTSEKIDYSCGEQGPLPLIPSVSLHFQAVYEERSSLLSGDARTFTRYFTTASYQTARDAANYIRNSGYKLVGSSEWDAKETHLMQHPSTKKCVLSFQGTTTERVLDWWDNLRFYDTTYCGLNDAVHGGFRDQLRAVVGTSSFKNNIQSKLPKCAELTVVGHSLGGALASLYSYCVNAGSSGGSDYDSIKFSRGTPEVLPALY